MMLLTVPFLTALIFCKFGRQILLVLLLAWLMAAVAGPRKRSRWT